MSIYDIITSGDLFTYLANACGDKEAACRIKTQNAPKCNKTRNKLRCIKSGILSK